MIVPPAVSPKTQPVDPAKAAQDSKLRKVSQQMEGAFVQQMYKAMRETVPTDGLFGGGEGEDMFTSMMDEHAAADTPLQWKHGLSEAIFRQMRSAVEKQAGSVLPPDPSTALIGMSSETK